MSCILLAKCVDLNVRLYYSAVQNLVYGRGNVLQTTAERSDTPPIHCAQGVQQSVDMSIQLPAGVQWNPLKWPNCDNGCKMLGAISRRMAFGTSITGCYSEYKPALPPEGSTLLMWLFGHPLLWHVRFIWSEFIMYSYNDKLPVTSIFNTVNLSLKVLHFFR